MLSTRRHRAGRGLGKGHDNSTVPGDAESPVPTYVYEDLSTIHSAYYTYSSYIHT